MKPEFIKELDQAQNINDIFNTVEKYYNTKETPLTFVTRLTVISGIKTAIKLTNAKQR